MVYRCGLSPILVGYNIVHFKFASLVLVWDAIVRDITFCKTMIKQVHLDYHLLYIKTNYVDMDTVHFIVI